METREPVRYRILISCPVTSYFNIDPESYRIVGLPVYEDIEMDDRWCVEHYVGDLDDGEWEFVDEYGSLELAQACVKMFEEHDKSGKWLCPFCGENLTGYVGEVCKASRWASKDGYGDYEYESIIEYYCPKCGKSLPFICGEEIEEVIG